MQFNFVASAIWQSVIANNLSLKVLYSYIAANRFFTARRYDGAVYGVVMCLCICLSHAGIVSKRLNIR